MESYSHYTVSSWFVSIEEYSCEYGSAKFYALCGFGGVLSCGLTHTAVVPLDLVKCRIQVRRGVGGWRERAGRGGGGQGKGGETGNGGGRQGMEGDGTKGGGAGDGEGWRESNVEMCLLE